MTLTDLYNLADEIEMDKVYLFVITKSSKTIMIRVLDYASEKCLDGGGFLTYDEAYAFLEEFK